MLKAASDRLLASWTRWRSALGGREWRLPALIGLLVSVALLWSYWPTLAQMRQRWSSNPQYSHGFLVPVFAAIVLWARWPRHRDVRWQPSWGGLPWLGVAAVIRLAGGAFYLEWLDALSLLPAAAGVCQLLGGLPALRWAWPAILFLAFMLPAPWQLEVALAQPLQRIATTWSTYLLQTLGLPAVAEGNIIHIREVRLGVVEACSGLGMLITFFALSTAVALVLNRRWGTRAAIFFSAVPVAILSNVVRIVVTGVLHMTAGPGVARVVYHDLAGWLMMPLALGLLWLELKFLDRLFLEDEEERAGPVSLGLASRPGEAADASPPRTGAAMATPTT